MRKRSSFSKLASYLAFSFFPVLMLSNSALTSVLHNDFITVQDGKFVDTEGREVILHGANIVDKSREHDYLSWHGPEEFAMMREWGFNCIRLGIIWDGLEPEPGRYDEEYLAGVDKRIQWAKENGIYVLLDMHQDLFSAKFGADGAPEWAIIDDGKPHIRRNDAVWSMAYFTSPAIQAAFDNFWNNKPAPDGVGVQDHFALAWRHVAERYAHEPTVIGYDLFNEPFSGSPILQTMLLKIQAAMKVRARKQGDETPGITEIMREMERSDNPMDTLNDFDVFKAFVDSGASLTRKFESAKLSSFYNRVAGAIRQKDQNHIIFMETHILCNMGNPCGIVPIVDSNGNRDPLQAFAPHGYDIVTDTPDIANASAERIELIYDRHAETAKRLKLPALVGEWGAFGGHTGTLPAAQMVVRQIEKHLFSDTYWDYGRGMDKTPHFQVLARPYPAAIAGTLLNCQSDLESGTFSCAWKEDETSAAASRIYLPEQWFPEGHKLYLEPEGGGWSFEPAVAGSASGYLVIPSMGQEVERKLKVSR